MAKKPYYTFLLAPILIFLWATCGSPPSVPSSGTEGGGEPEFRGDNPATRPTPGFIIISGDTSDNGLTVEAFNSISEKFATKTDEEGDFGLKVREGTAYQMQFYDGDVFVAQLEFPIGDTENETTHTFTAGEDFDLDLGKISFNGESALPETNPLTVVDGDNDGVSDFYDVDDNNDGVIDLKEKDTDGDGFTDDIDVLKEEEVNLESYFTFYLVGKTLEDDIYIREASSVTIIDSTVLGNVYIESSENILIDPTQITGDVEISDSHEILLDQVTFHKNLILKRVKKVKLQKSHVKGNFDLEDVDGGEITNNRFDGEIHSKRSKNIKERNNKKKKGENVSPSNDNKGKKGKGKDKHDRDTKSSNPNKKGNTNPSSDDPLDKEDDSSDDELDEEGASDDDPGEKDEMDERDEPLSERDKSSFDKEKRYFQILR